MLDSYIDTIICPCCGEEVEVAVEIYSDDDGTVVRLCVIEPAGD